MTSEEAFPHVREMIGGANLGVVIIDDAHTYENSLQDLELYSSLMTEGFVVFHDSTSTSFDVRRTIHKLWTRGFPMVTIDREASLTIVAISHRLSVEDIWWYLCCQSNRGKILLQYAQKIVRPGDRVFDLYCGYSPLGFLLDDVNIFGCDRDPKIINKLREVLPQHQWEQIDERSLPFAELPNEIDVLLGLGVSRGHAWCDPQHVLDNVRYLLGRYFPRACLFEAAADYHDGVILEDLRTNLVKLRYWCWEDLIETDMDSMSRRKVLLAERGHP